MALEKRLGLGLRILLGVIGAAACVAGLLVAATEIRGATLGSPLIPTVLAALFSLVIVVAGALLIRGALRGHIAVRRTSHRRRNS